MKTQISNPTLTTRKESYMGWMVNQSKIERIQRTKMPFKMRLNAIIASDSRKGKFYS